VPIGMDFTLGEAEQAVASAAAEVLDHARPPEEPGTTDRSLWKELDLTPEQLALRDELRVYFAGLISAGEREAMLTERQGTVYREIVRRMGRDGWLGVGWPAEFGGRGLGRVEQQIFVSEAARADVPLPAVTLQTVGPTLQAHGTAEQKDFFLPKILAGEVHWSGGTAIPPTRTRPGCWAGSISRPSGTRC
jgi:alkylation response protein AidB-like acyl-CoA dehydrogenase